MSKTPESVALRELKTHLGKYMRQVKSGRTIVITEHGRVVGRIIPTPKPPDEKIQVMMATGLFEWSGKSLPPTEAMPRVRGKKTVAELVVQNRE